MPNEEKSTHVVIVGGGFAGLQCGIDLASHENIAVTLIDRNNYQQFQPLLYQVAASMLSTGNAAFALREIFRDHKNVDVQLDEAVEIDLTARSVRTQSGNVHTADYLVLATGSHVNFYGIPGAEQFSYPLYTLTDAEKLRSAILRAFEEADRNPESAGAGLLNFVVVGGGPTGVEMAGTLADTLTRVLEKEFRHASQDKAQVYLVEATAALLPTFSSESQQYAVSTLRERGVEVLLSAAVKEISSDSVLLSDGNRIQTKTVVWAAGIKASAPHAATAPPVSKNGRIEVTEDQAVRGFPQVYALGDLANAADQQGNKLPQLAAVAKQAGKACAKNIVAAVKGEPSKPFVYSDRGILAMIGRNAAIAELGSSHHEVVGFFAFVTWLGVHLALLTVPRAKFEALVEWAWEYFTGEHPGQLIDR